MALEDPSRTGLRSTGEILGELETKLGLIIEKQDEIDRLKVDKNGNRAQVTVKTEQQLKEGKTHMAEVTKAQGVRALKACVQIAKVQEARIQKETYLKDELARMVATIRAGSLDPEVQPAYRFWFLGPSTRLYCHVLTYLDKLDLNQWKENGTNMTAEQQEIFDAILRDLSTIDTMFEMANSMKNHKEKKSWMARFWQRLAKKKERKPCLSIL